MNVWIDADACPVVDIALRICRENQISCTLVCDTAHEFTRDGAKTLIADKGTDSADLLLANRVLPGDIIITQDYGLASICLAKGGKVMHQDGWQYTAENIDALLLVRHESRKHRAAGNRMKGPKKRTVVQNEAFQAAFSSLIQTAVQG